MHDFVDQEIGKVAPYGVYDVTANTGCVSVGISNDTATFAVNSIRRWLAAMGGREIGAPFMPASIEAGRAALKAAGYNNEKVVIINPTDFVSIGPLGDVTYDLFKKLGLNVEMVATDWGSVVQRRASKEPLDKGGWSVFHTW